MADDYPAELYGDRIGPDGSSVRTGIKAHGYPRLREDMADVELPLDATGWHTLDVRLKRGGGDVLARPGYWRTP